MHSQSLRLQPPIDRQNPVSSVPESRSEFSRPGVFSCLGRPQGVRLALAMILALGWQTHADAETKLCFRFAGSLAISSVGQSRPETRGSDKVRKAADSGDLESMNQLGNFYQTGTGGLPRDEVQAVKWYRSAAEKGFRKSLYNLGRMYASGRGGLAKDGVRALEYYRLAAAKGDAYAMNGIAMLSQFGSTGVPIDLSEAKRW